MPRTVLLIGTRKGCFILEGDHDRRAWAVKDRSARAGPSTTPCTSPTRERSSPPRRASGTARPCGAAPTSARPGRTRARALPTPTTTPQGLEGLDALGRARPCARGRRGARDLREPRRRRDMVAAPRRSPASPAASLGRSGESAAWTPRHLGTHARPDDARVSGRSCRASACSRRQTAARPGRPATAASAPTGPGRTRRSASASTASSARPATRTACTSRTMSASSGATTARIPGRRSPTGCRASSASRPPSHPHDRDTFFIDPARSGPRPLTCTTAMRRYGARGTPVRAGSGWTRACRSTTRIWRPPRGDGDRRQRRTGPLLRHEHRPGVREHRRGRQWTEIAGYLPPCGRSRSRRSSEPDGRGSPPTDADPALPWPAPPRRGRRGRRSPARSTGWRRAGPASATASSSPVRRSARTSTSTSTRSEPASTRRSRSARGWT